MTLRVYLTPTQIDTIREIFKDVAQIMLAGWVISPLVETNISKVFIPIGLLSSILFWAAAFTISKFKDEI